MGRARRARRRHRAGAGVAAPGRARCSSSTRSPSTSRRRRLRPSCGPTSATGSAGWRRCGSSELGGILADDMGLGKTLQALALICHARERDPGRRPVPGRRADERRLGLGGRGGALRPRARVEAVTDTLAKSGRTIDEVAAADVVVTTYTLLRLDADAYRSVDVGGADPRRGAVRQEPPGEDLPLRARAGRAVQAGDHRARRWRTT